MQKSLIRQKQKNISEETLEIFLTNLVFNAEPVKDFFEDINIFDRNTNKEYLPDTTEKKEQFITSFKCESI